MLDWEVGAGEKQPLVCFLFLFFFFFFLYIKTFINGAKNLLKHKLILMLNNTNQDVPKKPEGTENIYKLLRNLTWKMRND